MKYVYIAIFVALVGAGITIKLLYDHNQELSSEVTLLEAENAAKTKQANRLVNRPRTDDDVVDRLCKWADNLDRGKGKSVTEVSTAACH